MAYVNGHEDFMVTLTLRGNSVFIRYSENADGSNSSETWASDMEYMGVYVGQSAPADASGYQWIKFVGEGGVAAATRYTVEIPAAGSADKGDWMQAAPETTEHYNQQTCCNAPKGSVVFPSCTDPTVFTDHGLRIVYEEQLDGWVLWIDSLPENACTLTLVFIPCDNETEPFVFPVTGGDNTELEERVTEIERDYGFVRDFVLYLTQLADNPENDGAFIMIKDETIKAVQLQDVSKEGL